MPVFQPPVVRFAAMPQGSPAGSSLATLSEVPGTELRQLQATFESFREFVARYSPWLSDTNIFVETLEPVPVGAPVRLEIWLRDRPLLIRALGQVDWVRKASDGGEDGPPGVALTITYLDPASARLIDSIFRLYTGQQSAAMGKDVVETWELDVESLIDQAFPGAAPAPGGADKKSSGAKPTSADVAAAASPTDKKPSGNLSAANLAAAASSAVAPDVSEPAPAPAEPTPSDPSASSDPDSLDWTLPEGVVVADPGASSEAPSEAPTPPDDDSLDWTLPEGVVVADPGPTDAAASGAEASSSTPEAAMQDKDALDWTLPEGVVAADPDSPQAQALGEIEASDIEVPDIEAPDVEIPADLEELELDLPEEPAAPEPSVPSRPQAPVTPASEPVSATIEPPGVEAPAWAESELAARPDASLADASAVAAAAGAAADANGTVRVQLPPSVSEPATAEDDTDWEERLSSAFSEYEGESDESSVAPGVGVSDVGAPDVAMPLTPAAEDGGFGFGLVKEPEPDDGTVAEEAPAPLAGQTAVAIASPAVPAQETQAPDQATPAQEMPALGSLPSETGVSAAQSVAGAASASDESDANFLRRSVLAFLLAVVAVGLFFLWFRGRPATPSGVETVAEAPPSPPATPESTSPPAAEGSSGEAAAAMEGVSPETAPSGEPPAVPASGEPAAAVSTTEEPPAAEASSPPNVEPGSASEPGPAIESNPAVEPGPPPPEQATAPPPMPTQDPAEIVADVERRIQTWAAAWSQQDVAAYIECYAPDFSPPGTGRKTWENQRDVRIRAPASILVLAKDISVEVLGGSRAKATFYQDYETDTKHLYTWKTMELERVGDSWKIVKEQVGR